MRRVIEDLMCRDVPYTPVLVLGRICGVGSPYGAPSEEATGLVEEAEVSVDDEGQPSGAEGPGAGGDLGGGAPVGCPVGPQLI